MSDVTFIDDILMADLEVGQVYIAKQKYDAIGNRSNRVLSFDKGEELEVRTPNPTSEWWEVRSTQNSSKVQSYSMHISIIIGNIPSHWEHR